jgi:hypothetical protein
MIARVCDRCQRVAQLRIEDEEYRGLWVCAISEDEPPALMHGWELCGDCTATVSTWVNEGITGARP